MEAPKQGFFEETQDLVEDYVSNRLQLLKLQTAEKSAKLVSLLLTGIVMALLGFFILLFLSITAGYLLAQLTGSLFAGFGIVVVFYVLLLVVVLYLRKRYFDKYISNTVIKIFFESTADDDDTDEKK